MEAMGTMRDLDQIRERDDGRESSRLLLVGLGGLATACVLFAAGVLIGREGDAPRASRREDPLARLDALAGQLAGSAAAAPTLTYPSRLSDAPSTSSAPSTEHAVVAPSPAGVPAAALLEPTGRLRDSVAPAAQLPAAAPNVLARPAPTATVAPGVEGAYTLQVSSFRTSGTAQLFAQRLRDHGHHAFVSTAAPTAANVVWHRVRVGPFASLREANRYRADFELRERLPTFVVRRDDAARPAH